MLAALGPMGFCLLLMPFMPNLWTTCLIVLAFFFAYYVYEPPYRGLYPDLVPSGHLGRAQGVQHIFRGRGPPARARRRRVPAQGLEPGPVRRRRGGDDRGVRRGPAPRARGTGCAETRLRGRGHVPEHSWQIFRRESEIRRFLFANAAWEGVFAAARTFVVLYVIKGLGESKAISSAMLGAVGLGYVLAAVVASRLGDRFGLARVILIASFFYGGGFLVAGFAEQWHAWYLGFIVPVAFAGRTVMTLAWGLLFKLTPAEHRGAVSGLATTTKGIGLLLGAPLAGLAIDLTDPYFQKTDGYQSLWFLCGLGILAAIPLVASLIPLEAAISDAEPQAT